MRVDAGPAEPLPTYYGRYLANVHQAEVDAWYDPDRLDDAVAPYRAFASAAHRAYAPGKWTVIALLQHVLDTERVFQYRALTMARGPGLVDLQEFDEDAYAATAQADQRTYAEVLEELVAVRRSTLALIASVPASVAGHRGRVGESEFSLRQLAVMFVGHEVHHRRVLQERYAALR